MKSNCVAHYDSKLLTYESNGEPKTNTYLLGSAMASHFSHALEERINNINFGFASECFPTAIDGQTQKLIKMNPRQ